MHQRVTILKVKPKLSTKSRQQSRYYAQGWSRFSVSANTTQYKCQVMQMILQFAVCF